jgi:hypothetical protein
VKHHLDCGNVLARKLDRVGSVMKISSTEEATRSVVELTSSTEFVEQKVAIKYQCALKRTRDELCIVNHGSRNVWYHLIIMYRVS